MNQPPDAGLDALLKLFSAPVASYLLMALVQRRKLLLSLLKAVMRMLMQSEDKRRTDELAAVSANGNGQKLVLMNLENVMARIGDTEGDIRDVHRRIDKERRERLEQESTISGELAKLTIRLETYKRDTDRGISEVKGYVDSSINSVRGDLNRGFGELKTMLGRGEPEAAP